jgi:outer membrane lipoprotein-sorting protein
MHKLFISTAILAFSLSTLSAQNLDNILKDHYKASAQEKMTKVSSITTSGINTYAAMGIETGFTLYQSRPNKLRVEAEFQGSKIIQTYNGTTGWMYAPAMGINSPQELGTEELKTIMSQAEFESPLWDYKSKGKSLELLGATDDGSAHMIKVRSENGDELTLCINKKTSLISKIISVQNVNGADAEIEVELKDYKDVKGIPTPHYMATKMAGQVANTIKMTSIEFDKKLDASLFEKPVVE